ncbi:unnamed protein product [Lactuca saligna]|uniref:Pentatricopeptide repeat-containing protein n=1 Tax=Lactuca saligna TaxID=75948 RepID=A0AA35ZH82_LACSI|nr:unnamed protein product [Lactuca saligna]
MIRLIQILENYGNWKQVLQVIEWMQARERFKSNRIRNIYTAALDALGKATRPMESLNKSFESLKPDMLIVLGNVSAQGAKLSTSKQSLNLCYKNFTVCWVHFLTYHTMLFLEIETLENAMALDFDGYGAFEIGN